MAKIDDYIVNCAECGISQAGKPVDPAVAEDIEKNFAAAMDDDFNTAAAIAHLFAVCKYANTLLVNKKLSKEDIAAALSQIRDRMVKVYSVIGLLQEDPKSFVNMLRNKHLKNIGLTAEYIEDMIIQRKNAKAEKDFEKADRLRAALLDQGIILNDSKDGTSWDIKELYNIGIE
jgi:cysteinyl-tRNA synthetase